MTRLVDAAGLGGGAAGRGDGEFVASRLGQFYYRAGCNAARRLSAANLISFATAAAAEQAGYRRSRASGC
jgi:methylphosphotriester-DNA--protein-cysteine methyltransferase